MKNIIANALRIFTRNKEYIGLVITTPIIIFLCMTIVLPYSESHSIAVINNTDDTAIVESLENIDGISIQDIDEEDIAKSIVGGNIDLAVIIDEAPDGSAYAKIVSTDESEISGVVNLAIKRATSDEDLSEIVSVNDDTRGKRHMGNASAFMLYKFIQGGSLLGAFIITERRRRMKDRIMLSNIKSVSYIGGIALVFFIGTIIGSFLYWLTVKLLDFDLGMRHSVDYLLMVILANVFSIGFAVFIASLCDTEDTNNNISMAILTILGFFSGIFFPYDYMPKAFRAIGLLSPQRWISHGIERIQETGTILSAAGDIAVVLGLSIVFYTIGAIRCGKKLSK